MRYDERDIRIFRCHKLDGGDFADRVVEHRNREGARHLEDFSADPGIVAMHLDPNEAIFGDSLGHHVEYTSTIARRVHKGEAIEMVWTAGNNPRDRTVGDRIVGMKGGEEHGAIDAGTPCTQHV